MALTKDYLNKLKQEAQDIKRTMPKDFRYDYECYDDHFIQSCLHIDSIEQCMEVCRVNDIRNINDLLEYVGSKIFN